MMRTKLLMFALVSSCTSSGPKFPKARFANQAPVTIVDDRRNVPVPPKAHRPLELSYGFDVLFRHRVIHTLEVRRPRRAMGVNSLDEVPDSTWFTNRIGLTPEQVRTGPVTVENPELHTPWTIQSTKYGGASSGFIIVDARGIKYQLKFDDKDLPEVQTGAEVVVDRLLWACGYNVPADEVFYIKPSDLVLAPNAEVKDRWGRRTDRLTEKVVKEKLALAAHGADGRLRGTASRWLDGVPLGDPPAETVRKGDPNDLVPHEQRRDLRGMYPIYAWLDMVDVWPGNFLDMWVADQADPQRHYVKHYALDFDRALAVMGTYAHDPRRGYTYRLDWPVAFASMFTVGAYRWPWEDRLEVNIPGVASLFTAWDFDPSDWRPDLPYPPFDAMDRFDGYWGAKIVARFTREQIQAAVEAGRFSDPRAVEYITSMLIARQRKTAAYWYHQVNPIDRFSIVEDQLCFDDLAIVQHYVENGVPTQYVITPHDIHGRPVGAPIAVPAPEDGRTCARMPALGADRDAYTIFEVRTERRAFRETTYVHVARDRTTGALRVIGIWRI